MDKRKSTPASARRKRLRPEDETASSPVTATSGSVPASKKRRVDGGPATSTSTPTGFGSTISAAVKGFLWGKAGPPKKRDSPYDEIPSSGADDDIAGSPASRPAVKYGKFSASSRKPKERASSRNIYDVPDSDDELQADEPAVEEDSIQVTPSKSTRSQPASAKSSRGNTAVGSPSVRQSKATALSRQKGGDGEQQAKSRGRASEKSEIKGTVPSDLTPKAKRIAKKDADPSPSVGSTKLKGILTPQKNRGVRPRKSVVFDGDKQDDRTSEVFFEDLPLSSNKATKTTKATKSPYPQKRAAAKTREDAADETTEADTNEGADEDEEEDDEVCVICLNPDSKKHNEIIFCESCDKGFHQKCYNVPVIPTGDWICRECSQEDVLSTQPIFLGLQEAASQSTEVPKIANFEQHLRGMQRVLLDRCSGNRRIKLQNQSESYDKAFQLVEQTVLSGEGNSMMIIGSRGCGKTTLVETIISDLEGQRDQFHVVRLSGFIHTDDKLALKEIWRQLGKEMDLEDDLVNKPSNYADTMASLLALLSHPAEITGTEEGITSKSVVFVIDEFDLFASHARQTLLYNLFDIAQARKAPIAVLGLTTKIDVVESLEKRVKSRFSHRYVYMSQPKTLGAYWDVCKQGLMVDDEDFAREGLDTKLKGFHEFLGYWNRKIEDLRNTSAFSDHLEYNYYTSKSVPEFLTSCVIPLSTLSTSSLALKIPGTSAMTLSVAPCESKLHLLAALSDLELALLISAARLDIVAHTDTVNFAMAYDEYSSQMGKQRVQTASSGMLALGGGARLWGRGVSTVAWERLVSLALLIPAGIGARSNSLHAGLEGKMWKLDVALEEIPHAAPLPAFLAKWCTQI